MAKAGWTAEPLGWPASRAAAWVLGVAIAVWQAVVYRQWVNGDAISYLDMSDAIPSHQWNRLVNATWSPLYPALIGTANAILLPSPATEFPVAHLVNFLCFLFSFACFEFLLRSMLAVAATRNEWNAVPLPRWAFLAIGYSLFLWASLGMLTLMKPTPDMLMSAFLYLAAGLLIRIMNGADGWRYWITLGVVLGVGYLAKAIMFPLGVIMVGLTLFLAGDVRKRVLRVVVAGLGFAAVAGPYVVAVSRLAHRPTFGEAGTVVHLIYVDRIAPYWQGPGDAKGNFVHQVKKIVALNPPAFSFARPLAVTTAAWFDPYYWSEGVRPSHHWRRQAGILRDNLLIYAGLLARTAGLVLVLLILCYLAGGRAALAALIPFWPLLLVSAAALGAYATLHLEERYVGGFLALGWAGLLYGFRLPAPLSARWARGLVALVVVNLGAFTALQLVRDYRDNESKTVLRDYEAADVLHSLGIAPGDRVAAITPWVANGWARLARVSIIAEVQRTKAKQFWKGTADYQAAVLAAFAAEGCRAVVAWIGEGAPPAGWQRLGNTPYAVHLPM